MNSLEEIENHPVRSFSFWQKGWENMPLAERIKPAPPELIEYLHIDNEGRAIPKDRYLLNRYMN